LHCDNVCRLEEQHSTELQTYQEESQRYRLESETAKQDLAVMQEELKQQVEAAQRGPSATTQKTITMLRAQLQDREAKEQLLLQTINDLQVCFSTNFTFVLFSSGSDGFNMLQQN